MHIDKIHIENFRILKETTLDMRDQTTILVGKNNTGKTSFAVLLEKFLHRPDDFEYSDFPLELREQLFLIDDDTEIDDLSIRLVLRVEYSEDDNIEVLSEFMLDLDSNRRHVNILLECKINKPKLVADQPAGPVERKKFVENNLGSKYLDVAIYAFDDFGYAGANKYYLEKRDQLEEKTKSDLDRLLNFQVVHARRSVASSEDGTRSAKALAGISTKFFKGQDSANGATGTMDETAILARKENLEEISKILVKTDEILDQQYSEVFGDFLKNSREFLGIDELKVVSNIQSQNLIENSSQVIYGAADNFLPENHSGLGYLNILYLLLQIEMCRENFSRQSAPLNLLIIEEPEAHTHPQMQYVFADKIHALIKKVPHLQAVLSTHSSHIVAKSPFEDIRYLFRHDDVGNVTIKNFHTDLKARYDGLGAVGEDLFKFLKQYLTINSAELFFANKAIFIEGTTERMLLPWFIQQHDEGLKVSGSHEGLSSQNITVLEVGANARAFAPFLDFIGIKALILTDIDTTHYVKSPKSDKKSYQSCPVNSSTHTSNETIKFFLAAPDIKNVDEFKTWHTYLLKGKLKTGDEKIKISYQQEELGYHARSFEDAFFGLNLELIDKHRERLRGLKKHKKIELESAENVYELTQDLLDKKSDFAASILFTALTEEVVWKVPSYIKEGLSWLHKN